MDDLAGAAGISRQGLYLHFATKEALFKDAVLRLVSMMSEAAHAALAYDSVDIETRLLNAFDALHGHSIEKKSAEHMNELMETSVQLVGSGFTDMEREFSATRSTAISTSGVAARLLA